jgi:hypothetical protein
MVIHLLVPNLRAVGMPEVEPDPARPGAFAPGLDAHRRLRILQWVKIRREELRAS